MFVNHRKTVHCTFAFLLLLLISAFAFSQGNNDSSLKKLEREIARYAQTSGGVLGVCAVHIETQKRVCYNASDRFPMASVRKIPIALQLLTLVDQNKENLDRMIELKVKDMHPGSGELTDKYPQGGIALSVRNLLELMMIISDNTATDKLLSEVGGPDVVTARLRSFGIENINVNRPTYHTQADYAGVKIIPPESEWNPEMWTKLFASTSREEKDEAIKRFESDPRDTSTPEATVALLQRIHKRELLKPASSDLLLDIMLRCTTGPNRLKGLLPLGTIVRHKTGTTGRMTNDVGIITLPDNAGHIAIAVFVKSSVKPVAERERAIAEVSRSIYDYFLFHS